MSIIIFLTSIAFARESLYKAPVQTVTAPKEIVSPTVTPSKVIHGRSPAPVLRTSASSAQLGNLDSEILVQSNYRVEDSSEITPKEKLIAKIKGVKPVDVLEAEIREEITAFPDSKIPARVVVTSGRLKGAVLIGEATLEKNSKKVSINFKELVSPRDHDPYPISGYALVEGEHHTNEGKFFLAEFLAAGAAGFADASISRSQNMYGNYVDEPSLDTSGKKALGSALNKSAERYAEKSRNAPEYTVISPYSTLQVLLTD